MTQQALSECLCQQKQQALADPAGHCSSSVNVGTAVTTHTHDEFQLGLHITATDQWQETSFQNMLTARMCLCVYLHAGYENYCVNCCSVAPDKLCDG